VCAVSFNFPHTGVKRITLMSIAGVPTVLMKSVSASARRSAAIKAVIFAR
jgi:hypothetical protein